MELYFENKNEKNKNLTPANDIKVSLSKQHHKGFIPHIRCQSAQIIGDPHMKK